MPSSRRTVDVETALTRGSRIRRGSAARGRRSIHADAARRSVRVPLGPPATRFRAQRSARDGLERLELAARSAGRPRQSMNAYSSRSRSVAGRGRSLPGSARPAPGRSRRRPGRSAASAPGAACWIGAGACRSARRPGASKVVRNGMRRGPPEERIEPAAIAVRARCRPATGASSDPGSSRPSGWGGKTLGPPTPRVSRPLHGEGRVADQLGVEPQPRLPPEQAIVGIDRLALGPDPRRLAIRRRARRSGDGSPSGSSRGP